MISGLLSSKKKSELIKIAEDMGLQLPLSHIKFDSEFRVVQAPPVKLNRDLAGNGWTRSLTIA